MFVDFFRKIFGKKTTNPAPVTVAPEPTVPPAPEPQPAPATVVAQSVIEPWRGFPRGPDGHIPQKEASMKPQKPRKPRPPRKPRVDAATTPPAKPSTRKRKAP